MLTRDTRFCAVRRVKCVFGAAAASIREKRILESIDPSRNANEKNRKPHPVSDARFFLVGPSGLHAARRFAGDARRWADYNVRDYVPVQNVVGVVALVADDPAEGAQRRVAEQPERAHRSQGHPYPADVL